jgi:Uma2 family endonuclease
MTTATQPKSKPFLNGQRFVLWDVGWEGYQALLKIIGDRPIHLTYDRGNVELMSPLPIHERYKSLIGRMIETITEELELPAVGVGSTTFNREAVDRGLEPDECYYLANASRIKDWNRINLDVDPPPDLAVEVDVTRSSLDRLGIYAALRVPEVWRFDGENLTVLLLQADGSYAPSAKSAAFPWLPMDELAAFLRAYDPNDDSRWGRKFREWVRATVLPKVRDSQG